MLMLGLTLDHCTLRFGSTAKVLLKCKLKYYRISVHWRSADIAQSRLMAEIQHCWQRTSLQQCRGILVKIGLGILVHLYEQDMLVQLGTVD